MADYDGFGQLDFVEDGARPEDEGGDGADEGGAGEDGVQHPAGVEPEQEVLRWWENLNWKLIAGVGVVAIGGVVVAYFLYKQHKKIQHLERSLLETTHALETFTKVPITAHKESSLEGDVIRNSKGVSLALRAVENLEQKVASNAATGDKLLQIQGAIGRLERKVASNAATGDKLLQIQGAIGRLEQRVQKSIATISQSLEQSVSTNKKDISVVEDKVVNTQRFIVDMAQRQKWPWPFNNRIKGLEEEFGLPKK